MGPSRGSSNRGPLAARLLLLLVVATLLFPAACSSAPPPPVPDCTLAVIPGLTQAPAAPEPLDGTSSIVSPAVAAGALPGSGSVTPAGEYRYRIPLDVPPGRAGMAPSLALAYSSRGKNGHLGVGWQIEGLSEIDRCPKTFAVDGLSDGVRLDENDAFCLDGHELVLIGPSSAGSSCDEGNAIASFRVFSKDGRIRDYTPVQIPSAYPVAALPGDNPVGGTVNLDSGTDPR